MNINIPFFLISVISIVAWLIYIPLKFSGVFPIKDNLYRPPLTIEEFKKKKKKSLPKIDPDLIQYR
jgi:SRSO17 transposase